MWSEKPQFEKRLEAAEQVFDLMAPSPAISRRLVKNCVAVIVDDIEGQASILDGSYKRD